MCKPRRHAPLPPEAHACSPRVGVDAVMLAGAARIVGARLPVAPRPPVAPVAPAAGGYTVLLGFHACVPSATLQAPTHCVGWRGLTVQRSSGACEAA